MVCRGRSIALVVAFLIGYAVLLMAGVSGVQAEASKKVEARCQGTRKINMNLPARFTTNDLPGCPKGGLLSGTDGSDRLAGEKGDDEVRGLGGGDDVEGGDGNDVIYGGPDKDATFGDDGDDILYGGPGDDFNLTGDEGNDVIHGGPGDDHYFRGSDGDDVIYGGPGDDTKLNGGGLAGDGQRDKIYCGEGRDTYYAEKIDYVASSCEVKLGNSAPGPDPGPICTKSFKGDSCRIVDRTSSASASYFSGPQVLADGGGPSILLPAAALLLGSGILTYAILRRG